MQNVGKTAVGDGNSVSTPAVSLQNAHASLSRDSKLSIDVIMVFCQLCSNRERPDHYEKWQTIWSVQFSILSWYFRAPLNRINHLK